MNNNNHPLEDAFDFGQPTFTQVTDHFSLPSPTLSATQRQSTYLTGAELQIRFGKPFEDALNDMDELTQSAVQAHKKSLLNERIRKAPRYFGKAAYWALTASVVAIPFISDTDIQQFEALKGAFSLKSLAAGAFDGLSNDLDSLFSVIQDNASGFAKFAGWQFAIGQAKGSWDNLWDQHLGSLSSGHIKLLGTDSLDVASVVSAYNRLGISFYCSDNSLRDRKEIVKDIESFSNRVSTLKDIDVAHFMRASGILPHTEYTSFISSKIQDKIMNPLTDKHEVAFANSIAHSAPEIGHAIYSIFKFDRDIRPVIPTAEKLKDKFVLTKDEAKTLERFLTACGACDSSGLHNSKHESTTLNMDRGTISSSLVTEHILTSILSGNQSETEQLSNVINICKSAMSRLGINNITDAMNTATQSKSIELFHKNHHLIDAIGKAELSSLFLACNDLKQLNRSEPSSKKFNLG